MIVIGVPIQKFRIRPIPDPREGLKVRDFGIFSDFPPLHYFLRIKQEATAYELFVYEIPVVGAHPQVPDRKGKNVIKDIRRRPGGPKIWISWKSSPDPGV